MKILISIFAFFVFIPFYFDLKSFSLLWLNIQESIQASITPSPISFTLLLLVLFLAYFQRLRIFYSKYFSVSTIFIISLLIILFYSLINPSGFPSNLPRVLQMISPLFLFLYFAFPPLSFAHSISIALLGWNIFSFAWLFQILSKGIFLPHEFYNASIYGFYNQFPPVCFLVLALSLFISTCPSSIIHALFGGFNFNRFLLSSSLLFSSVFIIVTSRKASFVVFILIAFMSLIKFCSRYFFYGKSRIASGSFSIFLFASGMSLLFSPIILKLTFFTRVFFPDSNDVSVSSRFNLLKSSSSIINNIPFGALSNSLLDKYSFHNYFLDELNRLGFLGLIPISFLIAFLWFYFNFYLNSNIGFYPSLSIAIVLSTCISGSTVNSLFTQFSFIIPLIFVSSMFIRVKCLLVSQPQL